MNARHLAVTALAAAGALAVPAAAPAHVTLQPKTQTAGAYTVGPITERLSSVTFTGSGRGLGRIAPGQFKEFPLSLKLPDRPGTLTFPAYQTYSDGAVVGWTGGPDADRPAPALTLAAPPTATAAHAGVKRRTPAPGSTARNVRSVRVTFGRSVVTGLITVTRGGAMVNPARAGLAPKSHAVLRARFARPLAAGRYTVAWRALSDDGHRQSGSWSFTVR